MIPSPFIAAGLDISIPTGGKSTGFVMQDMFLILASGLGVALLLGVCIYWWTKSRRHHHHHHHGSTKRYSTAPAGEEDEDQDSESGRRRKRRRKRKHEHRPRNPTLAETGGLPPVRQGDPTEPPL